MDLLKGKSDDDLLKSILAEVAKAQNEIRCARGDIDKAQGRLGFLIVLANELINRKED
jgi:hypothetical protein